MTAGVDHVGASEEPHTPGSALSRRTWRAPIAYMLAALLSLGIVIARFELWDVSLSIPLKYDRDALTCLMYVKAQLDNGWYANNAYIGMPVGWSFYDFPALHTFEFAIMKALSLFVGDYARLANLYYLLTFPLTALCAVFALRQLRVSYPAAVVGGILYGILPYHFFRGVGHLFLSAYYAIPLAVVLAVWVGGSTGSSPIGGRSVLLSGFRRGWLPALVLCSAVALSHIYYVFFAVFMLLIAGGFWALTRRRLTPLLSAAGFLALILVVTAVNYTPVFIHRATHGTNPLVGRRTARDPLRLGLELSTLVLPADGHGIEPLEQALAEHREAHRWGKRKVNPSNYLGAPGVVGFGILLLALLSSNCTNRSARNLRLLAVLNAWLLVLASVGGFGYVFALMATSSIRDYERTSVVVAFLAVAALMIVVDRFRSKYARSKLVGAAFLALLGSLLVVGVADQMRPRYMQGVQALTDTGATELQYEIDAAFVRRIENSLPARSMIFQLPHRFWPEGGNLPLYSMGPYDHFALYLHSEALRWSYGAVRGRPAELRLARTSAEPVPDMLESLCALGFAGVCIDRLGYSDGAEKITSELLEVLEEEPITSGDERRLFFGLDKHCDLLRGGWDAREWENRQATEHIVWSFGRGFFNPARGDTWRWCLPTGRLWIHNLSDRAVECDLRILLRTPQTDEASLTIQSALYARDLSLSRTPLEVVMPVVVPPGSSPLDLSSDAPSAGRGSEKRHLAFLATDPRVVNARWHRDPPASS